MLRLDEIALINSATAADNYNRFNIHSAATDTSFVRVMTLTGSGTVGIGVTNALYKLYLNLDSAAKVSRLYRGASSIQSNTLQ